VAREHGKEVRVYLGPRDISDDVMSVSVDAMREVHDVTVFASAGWRESDPGLLGWEGSFDAFYQPSTSLGTIGFQTEDVGNDSANLFPLSIYDGQADAIGEVGKLCSDAILTKRGDPINVAEMRKLSVAMKGNGRMALNGTLLHPLAADTSSGASTAHDGSAETTAGGRANLHVTSCTGNWDLIVQHATSTADGDFSALVTFSGITGATGRTSEVSGTVKRYLRAKREDNSTGSVNWIVGFGRY
jgi:hypothetical protein